MTTYRITDYPMPNLGPSPIADAVGRMMRARMEAEEERTLLVLAEADAWCSILPPDYFNPDPWAPRVVRAMTREQWVGARAFVECRSE